MAEFPALPLFTDAFIADTAHLNAAQSGAYLLLLMHAWRSRDCALPTDDKILARMARMDGRTWAANKGVILQFWKLVDVDGVQKFRQGRLFDERKYVEDVRNKNVANGRANVLKRKDRLSSTATAKLEPNSSTHTHTYKEKEKDISKEEISKKKKPPPIKPPDIDQAVWDDFARLRAARRSPLTQTALDRIRSEAAKAGWDMNKTLTECCARGWQGFQAAWINEFSKGKNNAKSKSDLADEAAQRALDQLTRPKENPLDALGSTELRSLQHLRQRPESP